MVRILTAFLLGAMLVSPTYAKGGHTRACTTCTRSSNGRIARSRSAVHLFEKQTGYPKGRKGYVVDHIKPLCAGGADNFTNMQWQTIQDAKAKDKVERMQCK